MRTIKYLPVPQNSDAKFPFSTIQNETDTVDGTPVVEEIYGDFITNIYKLLQSVGLTPTETQDSDTSQYQILEALKLLPNSLNDIEQVLSLGATTWSVNLNLDFLPNNYFFVARASEDYVAGTAYTFKGLTDTEYTFVSPGGFKSADELLVIIDQSGVRAYSLSFLGATASEVFTVMGTPLAFNDTNKLWYQESGKLLSGVPSVDLLEDIIRVDMSDGTVLLNDILVLNGYVLCFCLIPATNDYFFRQFPLSDLSVSTEVTMSASFTNADDFMPYVYAEQGFVYVTNGLNATADDNEISKLYYSYGSLNFVSTTVIDAAFVKTSNAVIKNGLLYTMIAGVLESYDLASGVKTSLGSYSGAAGQLFGFNGEVYFTSGEVAKKWF